MNVPQCRVKALLPVRLFNGQTTQSMSPAQVGYLPLREARLAQAEGKVQIIAEPVTPKVPDPAIPGPEPEVPVEEPPVKKSRARGAKADVVPPKPPSE